MDGPIFDAMLKTALEEALREDMEALEKSPPVRQSRRQKKRMRRMLADPWGYARRLAAPETAPVRRRNPARWAAVAVVAALLTGTAAGYALRGGVFFQQMFDASPWAAEYGGTADTEQLLKMGGDGLGAVVDDGVLRLELVDAVSDGQFAMAAVHMTVLDQTALEALEGSFPSFVQTDISRLSDDGGSDAVESFGVSVKPWRGEKGPGEYSLVFSIDDGALIDGGEYRIELRDVGVFGDDGLETAFSGAWTMDVSLRPGEVLSLAPELPCEIEGADWTLEQLTCSALALKMEFRSQGDGELSLRNIDLGLNVMLRMADGRLIGRQDYVCGIAGTPEQIDLTLEFQMPIDVESVESVFVCGQEIALQKTE